MGSMGPTPPGLNEINYIPELITLHTTQRHFNINTILFTQCTPAWSDTTERHYNAIKSVVLYFLPLGITSIAYLQIVRVLWRSGNIPGHLECRTPLNTISGNRREWGLPLERAESAVDRWSVRKVLFTTAARGAWCLQLECAERGKRCAYDWSVWKWCLPLERVELLLTIRVRGAWEVVRLPLERAESAVYHCSAWSVVLTAGVRGEWKKVLIIGACESGAYHWSMESGDCHWSAWKVLLTIVVCGSGA
ncbi:unnamed protein product [Nesidiocoris tenuis]|uniref:Uncharacterized protein n=1 Tax=Nesidiocoris tenuis TaxID=355587 RepID=A0A6H5G0N7_9HEMI|nr:unnamed protein product [Nesidiocoris tenuis]